LLASLNNIAIRKREVYYRSHAEISRREPAWRQTGQELPFTSSLTKEGENSPLFLKEGPGEFIRLRRTSTTQRIILCEFSLTLSLEKERGESPG
jgi:hypothetical protein